MGRFYKTDKPQLLDYMSKLPEQYLLMATQQASQDVQKNEAALYDIYGKLQVNALSSDRADADKRLAYYEDQINTLSTQLQSDPMAFRRKSSEITNLGRTLYKDLTRGELAAYQGNYDKDIEWQKTYQDLLKKGKLADPQSVAALRAMNLKKFGKTAYDEASGTYNTYAPDELLPHVDVFKHLDSVVSKMKPQIINSESSFFQKDKFGEDQYIVTIGGETKTLTKKEILDTALAELYSNNDVMASLRQRSEIGTMEGYYDKDKEGNVTDFIDPYSIVKTTDKKGNEVEAVKWNEKSSLAKSLQSILDIYEVNDITKAKHEIKAIGGKGKGAGANQFKGFVVDTETGRLTISSTPADLQGIANIDSTSVGQVTSGIKSNAYNNLLTSSDALINGVADILAAKNISGDHLQRLQKALTVKDEDDLDKVIPNVKAILKEVEKLTGSEVGDIRRIEDGLNKIDAEIIRANNITSQFNLIQKVSTETGIPVNTIYTNPTYNEAIVKLSETNGDEYEGTDKDVFNKVVDEIKTLYKSTADLGDTFFISIEENGKYVVKEVRKEEFRKEYGFTGNTTTISSGGTTANASDFASGGSGTTASTKYTGTDKAELGNISRIMDKVPAATLDNNGAVLDKPFKLKVNSPKGNVYILLDDEVSNQQIRDVDRNYAHKDDYKEKIKDINKMALSSSKALNGKQIEFNVPSFQLIDGVTYQPPVIGSDSRGQVIFTYGDGTQKMFIDDSKEALETYKEFYYNK